MILVYRAISWIASIVIAFSNVGALAEAPGTPAWNNDVFQKKIATSNLALSPKWDITFDKTLTEAFDKLTEETGMNIPQAISGLKDVFFTHRWLVKLFPGIFYGLRDRWLEKGDYWEQNGDGSKMALYRMLGISVGMPTKLFIAAEELDYDPDLYDVVVHCSYADGSERRLFTYTKYNKITGEFGEDNGISGLGYNFNFKQGMVYTTDDTWQRNLGYMKLYDTLVLKTTKMVNVDTVRLKFPYQGKDWMFQLWKGRYFNTTGGEIGMYNKPKNRLIEFYDAINDDERLFMSFKITTDDPAIPVLIDREVKLHWWMTGFVVRHHLYTPERLTLGTIIVPADDEMYRGLKGALDRQKVPYEEIEWEGSEENGHEAMPALEITWK